MFLKDRPDLLPQPQRGTELAYRAANIFKELKLEIPAQRSLRKCASLLLNLKDCFTCYVHSAHRFAVMPFFVVSAWQLGIVFVFLILLRVHVILNLPKKTTFFFLYFYLCDPEVLFLSEGSQSGM